MLADGSAELCVMCAQDGNGNPGKWFTAPCSQQLPFTCKYTASVPGEYPLKCQKSVYVKHYLSISYSKA